MEIYRIMVGANVSAPMSPAAFESKIRNRQVKNGTKVHLKSKDAWFDAKQVPFYRNIVNKMNAEKAAEKANKAKQPPKIKKKKTGAIFTKTLKWGSKPMIPNKVKQAANTPIHNNSGFTRFILSSAETFFQVIFWLVTAAYILFLLFSLLGLAGAMFGDQAFLELYLGVQIYSWIALFVSYCIFFVFYVLVATPILALVSIERNTRG